MSVLKRMELWSAFAYAGGTRSRVFPRHSAGIEGARMSRATDGESRLTFLLPISTLGYADVIPGRVIRVVMADATWSEWIVLDVDDSSAGPGVGQVTCGGFLSALKWAGRVGLTDADGVTEYRFDRVGLTPAQILSTDIIPTAIAAGLTCVELGTVQALQPVDFTFDAYDPLEATRALAVATGTEYRALRDDVEEVYRLELVTQIGVTAGELASTALLGEDGVALLDEDGVTELLEEADTVASDAVRGDIRMGKNATIRRYRSRLTHRTRVIPLGSDRATMGGATWEVVSKAGNVVVLGDPDGGAGPIAVEDQFVGMLMQPEDVADPATAITACDAVTQEFTLADATDVVVGTLVSVVTSDGDRLTYLPDPAREVQFGIVTGVVERSEIPGVVNVLRNSAQRAWAGAASDPPDDWAVVGTPTLTRTTTAGFTNVGGWSCRVQTTVDADGLATPLERISPTSLRPFFSGFGSVRVAAGTIRVELVATDGITSWTIPDGLSAETTQDVTVDSLLAFWGVEGVDLLALGATHVRMRFVQHGATAADFYVDAAQVTQSATQEAFVEGSGPRRLHQIGNEDLVISAALPVRYEADLIDLFTVDGTAYPYEALALGSFHRVRDPVLGIVEGVRLLAIDRNLFDPGDVRLTLSSRPEDLVSSLRARALLAATAGAVSSAAGGATAPATARFFDDAVVASDTSLESATGAFTAADVGATVWVFNAEADLGILKTTVAALVSPTEVTLADAAGRSATGLTAIVGPAAEVLTLAGGIGGARAGAALLDENGNLVPNVKDAGGRSVDRFFAKPISSDPDDFDSVADGSVYQKDLVRVLIEVEATASTDVDVDFLVTTSDPIGGAAPAIAVDPLTGVTDNGGGSYTIARPASGAGTAYHAFTASKTGRRSAVVVVAVPEQGNGAGPSLDVVATPGASNYSIAWSGDGVQLSIDGAVYGTPPASPISVARAAAGGNAKEYTFRASLGTQVVTNTVAVPSLDADTVTPDLTVVPSAPAATTNAFTVSATNPKSGGATPTIKVIIRGSTGSAPSWGAISDGVEATITSGDVVTVDRPAVGVPVASVQFVAELSGGGRETIQRTVFPQGFGPSLTVSPTETATQVSIAYVGAGTIEYQLDGGGWAAAAASPIVVSRNTTGGASKLAELRATASAQTIAVPVIVRPQDAGGGTVPASIPAFYVTEQNNSADTMSLLFTVANAPGGYTLDLIWSRQDGADDGNSGSVTGISTTSPYSFDCTVRDAAVDLVAKGTSGFESIGYRFTLVMKDGSTVVATATTNYDAYAIVTP